MQEKFRKSKKFLFFLIWAYLGFLPVSNIIPIPGSRMSERWIYITSVGFCALLALGVAKISEKKSFQTISYMLVFTVALLFCIGTTERNPTFRNNISIFQDITRCCNDFAPAYNSLGVALLRKGEYQQAREKFNKALEIYPEYDRPHYNLGKIYMIQGKIEKALPEFIKAAWNKPEQPEYRYWLALAYERTGENKNALTEYKEFLKLSKKDDPRTKKVKLLIEKYSNGKEKL